jgi:hypothetical protein
MFKNKSPAQQIAEGANQMGLVVEYGYPLVW